MTNKIHSNPKRRITIPLEGIREGGGRGGPVTAGVGGAWRGEVKGKASSWKAGCSAAEPLLREGFRRRKNKTAFFYAF